MATPSGRSERPSSSRVQSPSNIERDIQWMTRFTFGASWVLMILAGATHSWRWGLAGVLVLALSFMGPGLSSASVDFAKGVARLTSRRR